MDTWRTLFPRDFLWPTHLEWGRVEAGWLFPTNCLLSPLLPSGPLQGVCCDHETHRSQ